MKSQLLAMILFIACINGLKAQTWEFTSGIESWNWGQSNCVISQSSGSLVISSSGDGNASFGITDLNLPAINVNLMVLNLKNQSNAPYFAVNFWVLIPNDMGGYNEEIRSFYPSITANSTGYERNTINLSSAIADYSNTWKINRIRFDAVSQTNTSVVSIDYIKLVADIAPDAPTDVIATAGNAQASVAFAAPASNGGSPILNYTATSNPGNITATGTTSPIIVTGLTNGTAYTFTVTANNSAGAGEASAASASVTPKSYVGSLTFSTPGNMSSYRPGSNAAYVVALDNNVAALTSKVEFYMDNVKIAEDLTAPYEHTITNVQSGYYKIHAAAINSAGETLAITNPSELFVGTSKVGVRPLPRGDVYDFDRAIDKNNPGGYFADYTGQYPFVASHTDVLTHHDYGESFEGDFRTKKSFFEHYLPFDSQWIDTNPQTNPLIARICGLEKFGVEVEHIVISREGKLYGKPSFTWGAHPLEWRLLFQRDIDDYRKLFKDAYAAGIIKHDNYKLIQLLAEPAVFYTDVAARNIIKNMDGVCYELHQYNVHWPLETGKSKDLESMSEAIRWTLANNLDYVLYYGPWRSTTDPVYYKDAPKDWILKYWAAGMPKFSDKMYYYTNNFPHEESAKTPVGPETNPDSHTGFVKWLIEQAGRQTPLADVKRVPNMGWNFDNSVERWGAMKDNCKPSWSDGSFVIEPIAAGAVVVGITGHNFQMKNVEDFYVRIKNESPATNIEVNLWIAKPGTQSQEIKTFTIPIAPNSTEYETYHVDLTKAISGYSTTWRVQNMRVMIPNQTLTSKISVDYIKFLIDLPMTESIAIEGSNLIDGIGVKQQYSSTILPDLASRNVSWSVNNTNIATIDANTGLLTTLTPGEVVVSASANDGSGVVGTKTINIVYTPVSSIEIDEPATNTVNLVNDFKLLTYKISPANASNKRATWSVTNGTGSATIDANGKLLPLSAGSVTVVVKSDDNASISASKIITVTNVDIKITAITITSTKGFSVNFNESLQLNYSFEPYNASNNNVEWEVLPGTGSATIDNNGLLTASGSGIVTVKATAKDGSGISAQQIITITRFITNPTSIEITGSSAAYDLGLQIPYSVNWNPANTTWKSLTWSVNDNTLATIDEKSGLLTTVAAGTVTITVRADSTQEVFATKQLRILNESVTAKVWNFDSTTEYWDWGIARCNLSQAAGNLVVNFPADPDKERPNFGNGTMNFSCNDVNYFVIRIKNESAANLLHMWIWASTPTSSEKIYLLSTPVLPYQSEFREYVMHLPAEAAEFNNNWNITRLRIDPETGGSQGTISFDYIKFVSNVPKTSSIVVTGSNTVSVGGNTQMGVQTTPVESKPAVRYSVNNQSIATIDAYTGVLTGVAQGIVTVTASIPGLPGTIGQKDVTVNNDVVKATSINILGDSIIDGLGVKKPYSVIFTPENTTNKNVKYSVDNQNIATIDENTGQLTTVAVGDVTITATAQDGSGVKGEKTLKIIHTVYATSISIVGPSVIDGLGKQVQLAVAFQPEATTNKAVKYSVDKPYVATVDANGLLTTVATGVVRIIAETMDGTKLSSRIIITVTNSTSINSLNVAKFNIFPNPASNVLTISSGTHQVNEIKIADSQGRIVYTNKEQFIGQKTINTGLRKGIYFVCLTGSVPFAAHKLIIE